jgi:mannose-6-phosphate isomerase-like protein (cupin superfamily)
MMYAVHIDEVEGQNFPAPYKRTIKHLHSPWSSGASYVWMGMSVVPPQSQSNPHLHLEQEECFFVYEGEGAIEVNGTSTSVRPGSLVVAAPGEIHRLRNTGNVDLRVLCVVVPPFAQAQFDTAHTPVENLIEIGDEFP